MILKSTAFIVYQPGPPGTSARVNISQEAETILAFAKDSSGKTLPSLESAANMCAKWMSLLGKVKLGSQSSLDEAADITSQLDVFTSHRRTYDVYAFVLDGRLQGAITRYPSYLFILKRSGPPLAMFQQIFREKHLSPREQDLVRLLVSDLNNKEIGEVLGLSPNTVKSYLKSLALKFGVSTRLGILAAIYLPKGGITDKTKDRGKRLAPPFSPKHISKKS